MSSNLVTDTPGKEEREEKQASCIEHVQKDHERQEKQKEYDERCRMVRQMNDVFEEMDVIDARWHSMRERLVTQAHLLAQETPRMRFIIFRKWYKEMKYRMRQIEMFVDTPLFRDTDLVWWIQLKEFKNYLKAHGIHAQKQMTDI